MIYLLRWSQFSNRRKSALIVKGVNDLKEDGKVGTIPRPIKRLLTFKICTIPASGDEELKQSRTGVIGEVDPEVIAERQP